MFVTPRSDDAHVVHERWVEPARVREPLADRLRTHRAVVRAWLGSRGDGEARRDRLNCDGEVFRERVGEQLCRIAVDDVSQVSTKPGDLG